MKRGETKDGFMVEDEVKFEVVGGASRREEEGEHFLSHTQTSYFKAISHLPPQFHDD